MVLANIQLTQSSHVVSLPDTETAPMTTGQPVTTVLQSSPSSPAGTTSEATLSMSDTSTYITIISVLAVVIAVLLLLLAVGGVLFLVCVLRAKASRREENQPEIDTKMNEAYGQVSRGRGGGGGGVEEAIGLKERPARDSVEYEVVS